MRRTTEKTGPCGFAGPGVTAAPFGAGVGRDGADEPPSRFARCVEQADFPGLSAEYERTRFLRELERNVVLKTAERQLVHDTDGDRLPDAGDRRWDPRPA